MSDQKYNNVLNYIIRGKQAQTDVPNNSMNTSNTSQQNKMPKMNTFHNKPQNTLQEPGGYDQNSSANNQMRKDRLNNTDNLTSSNHIKKKGVKRFGTRWIIISACCKGLILTGLIIGAVFLYLNFRPAEYSENCERKACLSNLVCVNRTCQCTSTQQYYNRECQKLKLYQEDCSIINCDPNYNLVCENGAYCGCSGNKKWNGTHCGRAYYTDPCTNTIDCYEGLSLQCLGGKCTCDSNNFWNGSNCVLKYPYGNNCNFSYECQSLMVCSNGMCDCDINTHYWSSLLGKCVNYGLYSENCTSTGECKTSIGLICNSGSNNCTCPLLLDLNTCDCPRGLSNETYYDGSKCTLAKSYNSSCGNTYECKSLIQGTICFGGKCSCDSSRFVSDFMFPFKQFLYLSFHFSYFNGSQCMPRKAYSVGCSSTLECQSQYICQSGSCKCNSTVQFWSVSAQQCLPYRNYSQTCTSNSDCVPNSNHICNTASTFCQCPQSLSSGFCDCIKNSTIETYYNGQTCVPAKTYNSTCSNGYECKNKIEGTNCSAGLCACISTR